MWTELITISDLIQASNEKFIISEELKSICEASEYFQDMSINKTDIDFKDPAISFFIVESK